MTIDFLPVLEDSKTIKIYDNSKNPILTPYEFSHLTLQIKSSILAAGELSSPVDLLNYIRTEREYDEIFAIRSDLLEAGEDKDIPDGIYTLEYTIDWMYKKENIIVIYQQLKNETESLLNNINYNVEIGNYDVTYVGDYTEYDVEKARLAKTLLDEIESNSSVLNTNKIEDAMKKLRKLLTII